MKILVINAGSSSLKFQLIDMTNEGVIAKGNCEKIGIKGSFVKYKANGKENVYEALDAGRGVEKASATTPGIPRNGPRCLYPRHA